MAHVFVCVLSEMGPVAGWGVHLRRGILMFVGWDKELITWGGVGNSKSFFLPRIQMRR